MKVLTLVDGATANGNHDLNLTPRYKGHPEAVVQIEISDTANVQILGRIHDDMSWVEVIAAVDANALQPITYLPQLRAVVSSYSAGSVDVKIFV